MPPHQERAREQVRVLLRGQELPVLLILPLPSVD
jgi:hypothetical protein